MWLGERRLPADLAQCIVEGRDIVIHSDATPTRTFCYVATPSPATCNACLHGQFDYFNIGTIGRRLLCRISPRCIEMPAANLRLSGDARFEPSQDWEYLTGNTNRRCPKIDKARRVLGYQPTITVDEGVRSHLAYLRHEDHA